MRHGRIDPTVAALLLYEALRDRTRDPYYGEKGGQVAEKSLRWDENVPGKYYVDQSCIASKLCVAVARANFRMSDDGHAYVSKQPETPEEAEACRQALLGCPVEAIGDDGE